jgi:hypothetical protein
MRHIPILTAFRIFSVDMKPACDAQGARGY